jgi:DNA gyrase subunit A
MSYGMSTIVDRALPKVEDGFLPVQRKILYSMMANKMTSDKDFFKCLDIIGNTTKYYVHGDSSLMGALSLLVDTNQTQSTPFILGHGNFGNTLTQGGYSAPRYTFAKLSEFSEKTLFNGIYDGVVDMIGDAEHKEPVYLPTMYPNILTMFTSAIAVGEACSFNGFNLKDICDYTSKYIPDRTLVASDYIIPDFPTDCKVIYNKEAIKNICDTGKGSIRLRAIPRFDEENNILSMFIPYSTTVERVLKEITNKLNIFKEITDVKDGSGYNKKEQKEEYTVDLYLRKNVNIDLLINKLYKYTSLESNVSYNMNCLINFVPKVRGINEILDYWIKFREDCIIKLTNKEIETKSSKLHIMLGLKEVLIDIDKAIKIIRFTEENKILKSLCDSFNIDEKQAQFIADMRLRNINKSYIEKQIKQIQELQKDVEHLKYIVSNMDEIDKIIIEQLQYISNKYGKTRQTEIIEPTEINQIPQEELIEDYNCRVFYTNKYIKKHLKQSENHKIVEGNTILGDFTTTNKSTLLIFTNKERRYRIQCSDLEQYQPSAHGTFVPKLLGFEDDEEIIKIVSIEKPTGFILVAYEDGNLACL